MTLQTAIDDFLHDLQSANKSPQTIRAYRSDLRALAQHCPDDLAQLDSAQLRHFFDRYQDRRPATRARKQSAIASFLQWAYRHEFIPTNPMLKIERIQLDPTLTPAPTRQQITAILSVIPPHQLRDRLLFRLIFETGLRIGEALAIYIEDLNLSLDDEHITVMGKGQHKRTLLLDDGALISLIKRYLRQQGYRHGPLFRAHKNYRGGPLRYQSVQAKWAHYCTQAGMSCTLHQLRHAHATELVNEGVSLATIRKRLGHRHIQTTLRYAQLSDETADNEIRAWRRKKQR
jgi:site-specific recombinase XerD